MLALADKVSSDLLAIIRTRPRLWPCVKIALCGFDQAWQVWHCKVRRSWQMKQE